MARSRSVWRCQQCGAPSPRWIGRCPDCGEFGTYVEEAADPATASGATARIAATVPLNVAGAEQRSRTETGIEELDRVLGGGLVVGSLVLLGGEPGIGKSTLLLQACDALAVRGLDVLYACGEESPEQIGVRARRLGASGDVRLLPEVDASVLEATVLDRPPALLVVDSIQTMFDPELSGSPGSVGQVRACTARLMRLAKDHDVTTVIVGHVTKDGAIAGPRVLEHMVDAVLYFEGDRDHAYRIVRSVKNRFGSSSEIGIFEMGEDGLTGVGDPAALFLGESGGPVPGSAIMAAMEGSRALLVEIQALVVPSYLPSPRRLATGIDTARLVQVCAVLERHTGAALSGHDIYVSIAGGVRVAEPAVDLPLALAILSARRELPCPARLASFGEIGLTGRVRAVAHAEARMREAARQGFDTIAALVPPSAAVPAGIRVADVGTVSGLGELLGG